MLSDLLMIAALLAAILGIFWVGKRLRMFPPGERGKGREMTVVDRLAVGRETALLIVRVRGRDYLVSEQPSGLRLVARLPEATDAGVTDVKK